MADRVANLLAFGSLAPEEPRDGLAQMQIPSWYNSGTSFGTLAPQFPEPPPSRQDKAFNTSIDRWKQLAKDVFFSPADALKAFNEKPTFSNALGVMPMGTFGGPLAKTADRVALKNAEHMWGSGASKEEIWNKTGWFPGPDGKWRFEIPDNKSRFLTDPGKAENLQSSNHVGPVSGAFDHPELYKAYPDAGNPNLNFTGQYGGSYSPDRIRVSNNPFAPSTPQSVLLHELQHGIQEKEGFARGANSQAIYRDLPQATNNSVVEQMRAALQDGSYGAPGDPSWHKAAKSFMELERQVKQQVSEDLYRRSAGEVEARAVQNRMGLTPEQARARYPWLDYDVPIEQQIVK